MGANLHITQLDKPMNVSHLCSYHSTLGKGPVGGGGIVAEHKMDPEAF